MTVRRLREALQDLETLGWGNATVQGYEGEQAGINVFYDIDEPDGVIFIRTGP